MKLPTVPSMRLDGRRALVTGASRGIGLACAAALAQAGAHVTLCARGAAQIGELAAAIRADGGCADTLSLDVLDLAAVQRELAKLAAFDILVNNAGMNRPKGLLEVDIEDYNAVLDLNLRSAFFVAQAVARRMVDTGKAGSIIHMSSQMGHVGGPNRTLYCASKWGLEGLSKAMALDLARYRIRVNTIGPTFIETPMTRPFFDDPAFRDSVLSKIKLGRLGQVEDLMGAVLYLASDASALMTGAAMVVDGGWTAD
jgi:NAD(P)-dependent dehydrogenase (short-subunit alcohol dehydrogenase family)